MSEKNLVLLKFYADWCGPCKAMTPVVKAVLEGFPNIKLVEVDIEKKNDMVSQYSIRSIPTLVLLSDDNEKERVIGALSAEELKEFLSANS